MCIFIYGSLILNAFKFSFLNDIFPNMTVLIIIHLKYLWHYICKHYWWETKSVRCKKQIFVCGRPSHRTPVFARVMGGMYVCVWKWSQVCVFPLLCSCYLTSAAWDLESDKTAALTNRRLVTQSHCFWRR